MERTLLIIKPDAVRANHVGDILKIVTDAGFNIRATRMMHLSQDQAGRFYAVHKERPFYNDLVNFMTSGKIVPVALERDNAVTKLREILGATDSTKAASGTIRNLYGTNLQNNASHGSDSVENGKIETAFFFAEFEF